MSAIASQITSLTIVYSIVYSDADQRKHQSSASLAFVWGFHRGPVNSPHNWPVTRKMFPFDGVIMAWDIGLAPNRRQTIIWTNADQVHRRIHAQYGDVIMGAIASQITNLHCLLNCLFRGRSKKTSQLRITGHLCGEFPAQIASNAENVSI